MIPSSVQTLHKHHELLDRAAVWVATGGYCGFVQIVPATAGSFLGLLLYLPVASSSVLVRLGLIGALFGLGIWASGRAEEILKTKDARPIVIDEIVGMWIALFLLPYRISYLLAAFLLFRVFDILKPFPAGKAEGLRGGLGVMADDAIAGLYANAILYVVHILLI